jgi:hypothetical protein
VTRSTTTVREVAILHLAWTAIIDVLLALSFLSFATVGPHHRRRHALLTIPGAQPDPVTPAPGPSGSGRRLR